MLTSLLHFLLTWNMLETLLQFFMVLYLDEKSLSSPVRYQKFDQSIKKSKELRLKYLYFNIEFANYWVS